MAKFKVKAVALVEFEVDFPKGVTASQARTRLVDEKEWSHRKSTGFVDSLIMVEEIEKVSDHSVMPRPITQAQDPTP